MDEQKYWRNVIAREIKAEHDRVKKYYSKKGANSGGISPEEQTRLNIFALCQSIVETYNEDIPPVSAVPPKTRKPRAKKVEPVIEPVIEAAPEPTPEPTAEPVPEPEPVVEPVEDIDDFIEQESIEVRKQNEFGEMI